MKNNVSNNNIKKEKKINKKIIGIAILFILIGVIYICYNLFSYQYKIIYEDYTIYKTRYDNIYVYYDGPATCITDPCPNIKWKVKLKYNDSNMAIVNSFINTITIKNNKHKSNTIEISPENLNDEENIIMQSIISNNESLLDENKSVVESNKYIIVTDTRWMTMRDDGGSHDNIYYEIDIEKKEVVKIGEYYHANITSGTPTTEKSIFYSITLNDELLKETKDLIDEITKKEDIDIDKNYNFYTIKSSNEEKDIYNRDTINDIKILLNKYDDYSKKQ